MALYKRGDSSRWWGSFVFEGKRYSESMETDDFKLADEKFTNWKQKIQQGVINPSKIKVKLRVMVDFYLNDHSKTNKKSYHNDETIARIVTEYFGDCSLSEITPQRIEQFKADRLKKVSGARVNRYRSFLCHVFTKAILWGHWHGDNPVKKVQKCREEKPPERYLTYGERKRLFEASPDFLKPIILTALKTGMRQGEVLKLQWEDVDLERGVIFVRNTKAGKMREIPIHAELADVLSSLERPSGPVFTDDKGKPLSRYGSARGAFERAVKAAKIVNFSFHDLRHTFGSELSMKGVDIKTIQEYMGHSTIVVTERYIHVSPSQKRTSIQLLGRENADQCYDNATVGNSHHALIGGIEIKTVDLKGV